MSARSLPAVVIVGMLVAFSLLAESAAYAQTGPASSPPAAAPVVSAEAVGTDSVALSWTAVEGATGYVLYRYDDAWSQVGDALTETTYTDSGLAAGQTYYYAVAATNAAGRGPWSDSVPVTLSGTAATATPTSTPALTPTPSAATPTPANTDRDVLVALYNATAGANWRYNTNWLSDRPLGEWHGVTTDQDRRVTEISLNENQLSGSIPSELGNLANLTYLSLGTNQLSGEIPSELGNLSNLIYLYLRGNQLSGCIPAAWRNVQYNDLDETGLPFCTITEKPAAAPALTVQAASATSVTATWTAVDGATGYVLYRYDNAWSQVGGTLTGTSYTDSGLTSGQTYHYAVAATNAVGRGPWSDSVQVTLPGTAATATPTSTPALTPTPSAATPTPANTDRDVLVALYNATAGANWRDNTNWLSDKPLGEWHGVTTDQDGRVTEIVLSFNELSGTIPAELGNLANLTFLSLAGGNQLSGSIPSELGNLANLTFLNLGWNGLSGSIPSELGKPRKPDIPGSLTQRVER